MIMSERRTRRDRATAQVVQKGLAIAAKDGRKAAAAAMNTARVPFRVIVRVLSEPAAQRRPDQR